MALKTVGNLKDSVRGILTGTNLDRTTNLNGAIERAARTLVQKADVPEASGRQNLMLYSGVYEYAAPLTIFGSTFTGIRPQGDDTNINDYVYKKSVETFERTKHILPNGYMVSFDYKKGVPIAKIAQTRTLPRIILDTMSDDEGWTAAGSASGLAVDETVYYEQPAALRFTLTGSSTGTLTKTLTSALDLSSYEGVGVSFLALRIPTTVTSLTSLTLKIGSSASAYASVSETDGFLGAWVADEFLLVAFDLSAASNTGTPDFSAIDYVQVSCAHTATLTNVRVGGLWVSLPSPHIFSYQTAAIFMASGANPSQTITDDNDTILLSDAAYTIFEYETSQTILMQNAGGIGSALYKTNEITLHGDGIPKNLGLYGQYRADNPSDEIPTTGNWYE